MSLNLIIQLNELERTPTEEKSLVLSMIIFPFAVPQSKLLSLRDRVFEKAGKFKVFTAFQARLSMQRTRQSSPHE